MILASFGGVNVALRADRFSPTGHKTATNTGGLSDTNATDKQVSKPTTTKSSATAAPVITPETLNIVKDIPNPTWTTLPLYVNLDNDAVAYARANPSADGADLIRRQGQVAVASWFGDWTPNTTSAVASYVSSANAAGAVPVMVLYAIPNRDCSGGYSAGGATSQAVYVQWIQQVVAGIGGKTAVVILEPDALAGMDCLSDSAKNDRFSILQRAVTTLKAQANTSVYIDAGNPGWQTAATMASRLQSSGISTADGFSLNVSNTFSKAKNQDYGDQLSQLVGGKHYVIDVSRNGNSAIAPEDWCNPAAAALGALPTTQTGRKLNDALLWIKIPWESGGSCNGAPEAGMNYWPYAVRQARNAGW